MKLFFRRRKRAFCLFLINRFCGTSFFKLKRLLLKWAGCKVGKGTKIVGPIYLGNVAEIKIGNNVWLGTRFSVYGNGQVEIGDNIDIAPEVILLTGSHKISNQTNRRAGEGVSYKIKIESGCWIGARSTLMGNITVKSGSVIGACSLVKNDVKENSLYFGSPARHVRSLSIE